MATDKKPKQILRKKDEEFFPYALRQLNQLRQLLDEETKDHPKMRAIIKQGVVERVGNWCVAVLFSITALSGFSIPVDTTNIEPYGITVEQFDSVLVQNYRLEQAQKESDERPVPVNEIIVSLLFLYELIVRRTPTAKDLSIISRLAGLWEWIAPNKAKTIARQHDDDRIKEAERAPDTEVFEEAKWIGGKIWRRIKGKPSERYPNED